MPDSSPQKLRPVWIASYPRSGNTFLRIILQKVFQLVTYSAHWVEGQNGPDPSAEALEDSPRLPGNWRELLTDAPEGRLTVIKTHGPPEARGRTLYLVRDGREAIHSYYYYHMNFTAERVSLTEVIAGACYFGSWSEHYRAWQPQTRPYTLFLRYEDLVARPEESIPRLARFLNAEPSEGRVPTFDELKQRYPTFFRRGRNQDFLTEWTPGQLALFNQLHGVVMKELGYPLTGDTEAVGPAVAELAGHLGHWRHSHEEQSAKLEWALTNRQQLEQEVARLTQQLQGVTVQLRRREVELHHCATELASLWRNRWVKMGRALHTVRRPPTGNGAGGLALQGLSATPERGAVETVRR